MLAIDSSPYTTMQSFEAAYPTGDHKITIEGQIVGNPASAISHDFTLRLIDPCSDTVLTVEPIPEQALYIHVTSIEQTITVTDSVSSTHGNLDGQTFCGGRVFTPEDEQSWF